MEYKHTKNIQISSAFIVISNLLGLVTRLRIINPSIRKEVNIVKFSRVANPGWVNPDIYIQIKNKTKNFTCGFLNCIQLFLSRMCFRKAEKKVIPPMILIGVAIVNSPNIL
jgi:hypothetical protein